MMRFSFHWCCHNCLSSLAMLWSCLFLLHIILLPSIDASDYDVREARLSLTISSSRACILPLFDCQQQTSLLPTPVPQILQSRNSPPTALQHQPEPPTSRCPHTPTKVPVIVQRTEARNAPFAPIVRDSQQTPNRTLPHHLSKFGKLSDSPSRGPCDGMIEGNEARYLRHLPFFPIKSTCIIGSTHIYELLTRMTRVASVRAPMRIAA